MKKTLLLFASIICLYSCGSHTEKHENEAAKHEEHHEAEEKKQELHLNDGERWSVNPATAEGMQNMSNLLNEMDIASWQTLGDSLKSQTDMIVKKCDMKGEAHEQLHLVLMPMLESIAGIKNASSQEEAQVQQQKLQGLLTLYNEHFE